MAENRSPLWLRSAAAAGFCLLVSAEATAAPMKIEAVIVPKADSRLDFADGSKRYLVATKRLGKAVGNGPLAGSMMLEWGVHDVDPATGAHANGYLIFTTVDNDVAYLKYQFRSVPVPSPDGRSRFEGNGSWEAAGGTGRLKALQGAGTVQVDARERRWVLTGNLVAID